MYYSERLFFPFKVSCIFDVFSLGGFYHSWNSLALCCLWSKVYNGIFFLFQVWDVKFAEKEVVPNKNCR